MNKGNLYIFTQGFIGATLLEKLHEIGLYSIIYTYSRDSLSKKATFDYGEYANSFNIRYIREHRFDPALINLSENDIIVTYDWTKDFFHYNHVKAAVYHAHCSLLPMYKGYGAVSEQFLRGACYGGLTVYKENGVVDGGDIVTQDRIKIEFNDYPIEYIYKCTDYVATFISKLHSGENFAAKPQDSLTGFSVQRRRQKQSLIDFNLSALSVYNQIRAYAYPYFGATFIKNGVTVTIWNAICEKWSGDYGSPGDIIKKDDFGVEVACGDGTVILTEVEIDGTVYKNGDIGTIFPQSFS